VAFARARASATRVAVAGIARVTVRTRDG